jgi:ABC-type phosphate/phosphonate transport system substrate-binding protein
MGHPRLLEIDMHRRSFLAGLGVLPVLPAAAALQGELNIGIYPGTAKAGIYGGDFHAYASPFAQALGAALGLKPRLSLFRSIRSVQRSMEKGRVDLYFIPPTVAVTALDHDYSPIARVRDQAEGVLIRRRAKPVEAVALPEKGSWLDLMARYTLRQNKIEAVKTYNFKDPADVILALQREYAQAGSLRSKLADELTKKGEFEAWHPLPTTPDFTLVASNRLEVAERDKLAAAAVALAPEAVQSLQKTINSKVTGFVVAKQADYGTIRQALGEAGD